MQVGDNVPYYHSSYKKPGVYGMARVTRIAYPDPTAAISGHPLQDEKHTVASPRWFCIDRQAVHAFDPPLLLFAIKAEAKKEGGGLAGLVLLKQPRLSVQPVTPEEFECLIRATKKQSPSEETTVMKNNRAKDKRGAEDRSSSATRSQKGKRPGA
eukprot:CAMPEP_0172602862 /NCGR_PEP_ID=MMETSP1068-20121228/23028_1 /TAXON_ID=35684 /ORGANISM="Pseudopedinella elastica, Strain CCMP716" /LENGTH=154 /DNA_ID=CAMNT_0013404367 /DNA_START=363 /DNA_END=827 /DNA_ORIENTATION=-